MPKLCENSCRGRAGRLQRAQIPDCDGLRPARREPVAFSHGPLKPALGLDALPTLVRPVLIDDRILIDGGATNPLPFDQLRGRADVIVAVDISGEGSEDRRDIPTPWECLVTTVLVMGTAITREKLKHVAPDLMVRPKVGIFRTLDFMQASAILRAAEPAKQEMKERLAALLEDWGLPRCRRSRWAKLRATRADSPRALRSTFAHHRTPVI
jgi:predicted acylesterase/phospholipase RssA